MMRGRFGRHHAPESHESDERYEAMVAVHHPHRSPMGHAIRHLQSRLMAGVLVFLPVFVTYVVFDFFYDLVNALLDPVLGFFRIPRYPGLAFAVAIVILYVMGLLIGWAVAKLLINYVHDVIGRIPVLGPVYNTTRMGIDFPVRYAAAELSRRGFGRVPASGRDVDWPDYCEPGSGGRVGGVRVNLHPHHAGAVIRIFGDLARQQSYSNRHHR